VVQSRRKRRTLRVGVALAAEVECSNFALDARALFLSVTLALSVPKIVSAHSGSRQHLGR
jgi:hypothetical protein